MEINWIDGWFDISSIASGILILFVCIRFYRERKWSKFICEILFGFYILYAIAQVFFPIYLLDNKFFSLQITARDLGNSINLIPFQQVNIYNFSAWIDSFLLNVALTIPFGFGISFISRIKARNIFWIALAVGLGTELGQLLLDFTVGNFFRVVDINDSICNTVGVLIGYGIFRMAAFICIKLGIERVKRLGYFSEIFKYA